MTTEQLIRRSAAAQLGLVTRPVLVAHGFTDDQIRHRTRNGSLHPLHPGVYLTGAERPTFEQRVLAACLACGDGAVVSGTSAAAVWGFVGFDEEPVDVTVPPERRPRVFGVRLHRVQLRDRLDRTHRGPIPITTHARTLLDVAGLTSRDQLEDIADEAFRRNTPSPARLLTDLGRDDLTRCRGITALRAIAADRVSNGVPESVLEADAVRLLRAFGLPEPVRQYRVRISGRNVRFDLAYLDQRLAIELDGRAPHWGRDAWQSDHDRHNAVELGRWRVLRFTWWDVHDRSLYVVLTIAEALGLRPRGWKKMRREPSKVRPR